MASKPGRKRITPQLVVASPSKDEELADDAAQAQPITNLKEQAALGKEQLGLNRKIYVDLSALNDENKEINWKQLLKERGVRHGGPPAKRELDLSGDGPSADGLDPLLRGRSRAVNPLSRVIARLEAAYCMHQHSDDSEGEEGGREEASISGSDDDGEGAEGGEAEAAQGEGKGKQGPKKVGADDYDHMDDWIDDSEFLEMMEDADKRKTKEQGFFISKGEIERTDELLPGFEEEKKKGRKKKAEAAAAAPGGAAGPAAGAPAAGGAADRGAPKAKKKAGDEQGAGGGERKAKRKAEGAAGAEGEAGGEPKKKKKKRVEAEALGGAAAVASPPKPKLGIAALAAMQGALATSSTPGTAATPAAGAASAGQCQAPALVQPAVTPKGAAPQQLAALAAGGGEPAAAVAPAAPPSGKKRYQMPEDVRAAVDKVRGVVGAAPQPAEGSKKKLPPELLAELKAFSPLFLREQTAAGVSATTPILNAFMEFMEPFASRQSVAVHLKGSQKERKESKQAGVVPGGPSLDALRALITAKVKPMPVGSDDDFEASPAPDTQAGPSSTAAADEAGSGGRREGKAAWKGLPKDVRRGVFEQMLGMVGEGGSLKTPAGKMALQEVYNLFPPNVIDLDGLTHLYKAELRSSRRKVEEAAAQQQAGGPPGTGTPAAAPAGAATAAAAAGGPDDADAFAELAAQIARKKLAPEQKRQQQEQPPRQAPPAAPAQQVPTLPVQREGAAEGAAAPPVLPPAPAAAGPAAAAHEVALPAAGPPAPTAPPLVPAYTDAQLVDEAVRRSADRAAVQELLQQTAPGTYLFALTRVLALAGPAGATVNDILTRATELGFGAYQEKTGSQKKGMSKATHSEHVAFLGQYKYALNAFPGVKGAAQDRRQQKAAAPTAAAAAGSDTTQALAAGAAASGEAAAGEPGGPQQMDSWGAE